MAEVENTEPPTEMEASNLPAPVVAAPPPPPKGEGLPVALQPRAVFGLKTDCNQNVHFAEENQIIYPVGHQTVMYQTDHKSQKFFPCSDKCGGVTALAVNPSKRYLAVAERGVEGTDHPTATVMIYDLVTGKKKKTISHADIDCREITWMAFSSETRFLLTQTGASVSGENDNTLIYWAWDKGRVMAAASISTTPIAEVSFNPSDSAVITAVGDGVLKFLTLADGQFREVVRQNQHEGGNYVTHSWLYDDRLVVACGNGDILLFDNAGEYKQVLDCSPKEEGSVRCLLGVFTKGFITGGDGGIVRVFEKSEDPKEFYRLTKTINVDTAGASVHSLALSTSEETLALTTSSGQLLSVSLLAPDLMKKDEEAPLAAFPVLTDFHHGPITGMDVCVRKTLLATAGTDHTIKIWNYADRTLDLSRTFNEECFSLAFHPSGFHMIVGFSDKLRLMNVLMEDLRTFKDLPIKACREVRFSNGGQFFAAVNSNMIQVYKFYSCEMIANLRGHNNKVKSLAWSDDDSTLVSTGADGAVYEYKITQEGRRVSDWVSKGTQFSSVIVYTDPTTRSNTMYAVGNDMMLKEVHNSQLQNQIDADQVLGQMALSPPSKTMFCTTDEKDKPGTIRLYKFPLDGEYVEYPAHSMPSARLRLSVDDQYLFSAGEDGSLLIFDVRKKDKSVKRDKENILTPADEILVTRNFLDEKQSVLSELVRQVEELSNTIDFQLRHRDSFHKEKMAELEDKYGQEIEQERTKFELLREEKNDMEMEYEENKSQLEELHAKQIQDLEGSFQHKMMVEVGRYQKLASEREALHAHWEEEHARLIAQHTDERNNVARKQNDSAQEDLLSKHRIHEEKNLAERVHEETLRQLEQDADVEIEELKGHYEDKLQQERDDKVRLRGQAGIHRKHHEDLKRAMAKKEEELLLFQDEARKKQEKVDALIQEKEKNLKEIKDRDKTIGEREQRIYDLKKQNQELEKFKFVLDYKIKELKGQIDPKNDDIAEMKGQIQSMDGDLEDYHRKNKALQAEIESLVGGQQGLQVEIIDARKKVSDIIATGERFKSELHKVVQYIQEPKDLADKFAALYHKYVPKNLASNKLDADIEKEYERQREYLEKSVDSLKNKLHKDSDVHRQDNMRIMQENVSLIREINQLRENINHMRMLRQQQKVEQNATNRSGKSTGADQQEMLDNLTKERGLMQQEILELRLAIEQSKVGRDPTSPASIPQEPPQ